MIGTDNHKLLEAVRTGDQRTVERHLEHHRTMIAAYVGKRVSSKPDADDIVQDTFIRAARNLPSFRGDCPLGNWLLFIAANLVKNFYRSADRISMTSLDADDTDILERLQAPDSQPCQTDMVEDRALVEKWLKIAREACSPAGLKVVILYYQGEAMSEIAELMGIPSATAWSHFRRARAEILMRMIEHEPGLLGGKENIQSAIVRAQNASDPGERLTALEAEAIANPYRKRKLFEAACLKIARFLDLPT